MAGLGNCSFGVQTQYAGRLFQRTGLETALFQTHLHKLSTRNALPAAGLGSCSFGGIQTQYAERFSSARLEYKLSTRNALPVAVETAFRSTNSVRGMLFQWPGLETAEKRRGSSGKSIWYSGANGCDLVITRLHPVAPLVPRSSESVGSSGNGVWDSGANGCDLVNYHVAPGRTSSFMKFGIRR